jgi:hypothetical protein
MPVVFAGAMCVLAGHDLMQPKSLPAHCCGQKYQQESSLCFTLHEVCLKSLPRVAGGYSKSQSLDAKPAFSREVTKEYRGQLPLVTLARTVRPGIHLPLQLRCRFKRRIALVYVPKKAVVTASTSSREVRTIPLLGRVSPRKCH